MANKVQRYLPFALFGIVLAGIFGWVEYRRSGNYVVGCTNPETDELHVYQSTIHPRVHGSVIYIGDRVFTTPFPGGVCRIVTEEEFEALKKESLDLRA